MIFDANTIAYLLSFISLVGIIFTVYNHFQNPQNILDKRQAVDETEKDGEIALLQERMKLEKEAMSERFLEMGKRLDSAFALAQNHIHTVDTKVDKLIESVSVLGNGVTELRTIINERIPKK